MMITAPCHIFILLHCKKKEIFAKENDSHFYCLFQVKDIKLYPELFSVDNGLLTPTFKTKRNELGKFFADDIAQMYSKMADAIKS